MVLWLAFGKLARDYGAGLQTLGEASTLAAATSAPAAAGLTSPWLCRRCAGGCAIRCRGRPFCSRRPTWLRDRDTKLRVYPGLAPMLVMPMFISGAGPWPATAQAGSEAPSPGVFLGLIPVLGLTLVQYSQQWQAADLFRAAPIAGPAPLCHGARRAVLCLLTLPVLLIFGLFAWVLRGQVSYLALLLPGIIALPIFALLPNLGGNGVPLSLPTEEAKSANRGLLMIGVMAVSGILSAVATWAWSSGWFGWLLLGELVVASVLYVGIARLDFRRPVAADGVAFSFANGGNRASYGASTVSG